MTKKHAIPQSSGIARGVIALIAVLVCLAAINFMTRELRWRRDLTAERLYTLSDGTRNIIKDLDRPVTLTFYYSKSLREMPAAIKTYAQRVEDLLHEYDLAGGRNLAVDHVDPRPDTEAEEWAIRHGIEGHPVDQFGSRLFMGLTAVSGDARTAIPMLDPGAEETLEYDITRMVLRVARPEKPVIGVVSRLPVMGHAAPPFMAPDMQQQQATRPWAAFQELRRDFDLWELELPLDSIAPDIRCLLLVHPPAMDAESLLAIDQYLLSGGSLIVFLDPMSIVEMETLSDNASQFGALPPVSSELEPLTTAWGVSWNPDQLVVDIEAATRVQGADRNIEENPLLLSLYRQAFNRDDIVTAGLQNILLPLAGYFEVTPVDTLNYETIIKSSPNVMAADSMTARFGIQSLLRQFEPRGEPYTLALRIHGRFPTAFPDGIEVAEDSSDTDTPDEDQADDGTVEQPAEPERLRPQHLKSVKPGVVTLVGNVDMLNDAYAVRQIPFFGAQVMQPINDNIMFLMNAVEQAGGGIDLLAIRARGRSQRPFTRVQELERSARLRWVDEEQRLQRQLQMTEQRLNALRAESDETQGLILTDQQRREIERFREEQSRTQAALREVRKNLREDIERLGLRVKIVNIVLVPLLVILAGMLYALLRHLKIARSKS